jgi:hypothetical protein
MHRPIYSLRNFTRKHIFFREIYTGLLEGSCHTCRECSLGQAESKKQTYLSTKLNSYGDKDKKNFKESALLHLTSKCECTRNHS